VLDGRWLYVAALPFAIGIVALGGGRRRTLVGLIALAHVVILANVALFPIPLDAAILAAGRPTAGHGASGGLNLVPFATIGPAITGHGAPIAARIAILNVFVLTPAGIYLPLLFRSLRGWGAAIPVTIVGGVSIEAAQLAVSSLLGIRYRSIDIDDVILNALGILIGWLLAWTVIHVIGDRRPRHVPAREPGGQAGATSR
jgi:glycopeptide antibiotics resistance protein